jgi:hypothetical protein
MERPYIWFRTGLAFSIAAIGIVAAAVAVFAVLPTIPQSPLVQISVTFVLFAITIFPAFVFDRLAWRRRQTFNSQRKADRNS